MSKQRPSKLDEFSDELRQWFTTEKLTLEQARARLAERGCTVSVGRLSDWWSNQQDRDLEAKLLETRLLDDIAAGARLAKQISTQSEGAPPQMAALVKLVERLIITISVRGSLPEQTKSIPNLLKPVLEWSKQQQSAAKLELEKQKFATALKSKIEAGLDEIAAQIGENPEARAMYDQFRAVITQATQ